MIEQVIVGLIVLSAVGFIGRRAWRTAAASKSKPGCDSDCGCGH
jgi:hypothetical protein